jgi:PAS domain S-box-containing protein
MQRVALGADVMRTLFERTATPMLLTDDERRYRDANPAAVDLLGISRDEILARRIDDFAPPEARAGLDEQWRDFIAEGEQSGRFVLLRPDGRTVEVDYSATAHILDGLHLAVFSIPGSESEWFRDRVDGGSQARLSKREREVLTGLALGESGTELAARLFISPDTVRRHVANARKKLGARTKAQAIVVALRRGEIAPP